MTVKYSTAKRMSDRRASLAVLLTRSTAEHMPFAGHRTQQTIFDARKRKKRAQEYGFEPR